VDLEHAVVERCVEPLEQRLEAAVHAVPALDLDAAREEVVLVSSTATLDTAGNRPETGTRPA
jgi:hypothetical protein